MNRILKKAKKISIFSVNYIVNFSLLGIKSLILRYKHQRQLILCCMAAPNVGGTELQLQLILKELKLRNLSSIVITTGDIPNSRNNHCLKQIKQYGIEHLAVGNVKMRLYHFIVLRILGAKILHVFNPGAAFLMKPAKQAGMSVIYMETGLPIQNSWWAPMKPYINNIDYLISVSAKGLDQFRQAFKYHGHAKIINSMIAPPADQYKIRPPRTDDFHIIYFGRLHPDKGLDKLLLAFKKLSLSYHTARLTMMGDGDFRHLYIQHTKELEITHKVRFIEWLSGDELFQELIDADVFCLPSLSEGSPCSIIEAMCIGLPVVATSIGGIPDLIVDGKTGLLIPPNDENAITDALQKLIEQPDLHQTMSKQSLIRYQTVLSQDTIFDKLLSLYQTLIIQKRKGYVFE
ncbi:MAG: glycosyltransferase family 4 protein [Gammaproteobacteria bacterium]